MDYIAVAIAGFLGAVTRTALGKVVQMWFVTAFPLGTFIVNLTGCFILGFFLAITLDRLKITPRLRLAAGTGFLGAYTTFSTFAVESIGLIRSEQIWVFLVYVLGTSVGCVAAAWAGAASGKLLAVRRDDEAETAE